MLLLQSLRSWLQICVCTNMYFAATKFYCCNTRIVATTASDTCQLPLLPMVDAMSLGFPCGHSLPNPTPTFIIQPIQPPLSLWNLHSLRSSPVKSFHPSSAPSLQSFPEHPFPHLILLDSALSAFRPVLVAIHLARCVSSLNQQFKRVRLLRPADRQLVS